MNPERPLCFLPDGYLNRKSQRQKNSISAAMFLIATLSIASAFAISEHSLRQIEAEHATVAHEFNLAAGRAMKLAGLQESQRELANHAELSASLLEKIPRSYVVAEITNAVPAGLALLDLSIECKPRAVQSDADNSASPVEVFIRISGRAESDVQVSQLVTKLSKSGILKDVTITDKSASADDALATGRKFRVEMSLDPDATMPEPSEAAPTRTTAIELETE